MCIASTQCALYVPFNVHSFLSYTYMYIQMYTHYCTTDPGHYGRYKVVPLTNSAQELARLHVEHLTCHLKQMRDTNTTLQVHTTYTVHVAQLGRALAL